MTKNLVSVIINCRNSEKYLGPCIDSVLNQTYSNFEIILIDNNSSDGTKEIVNNFSDQRIKYYFLNKHVTLGDARNFALNKANGHYIAFIDSDDLWTNDKLKKLIYKFSKNIGLIYSDVEYFNENKSFNLYSYRKIYKGYIFNYLLYDYNLCISSCIVSKKIIDKYKIKFDKSLKVCEDLDFFLKISYVSKVDFVPEVLAKYRIHQNNMTSMNFELFFTEYESVVSNLIQFFNIESKFFNKAIDYNYLKKSRYFWKRKQIKDAFLTLNQVKSLFFKRLFHYFLILIPYKIILFIYKPFSKLKVDFNENL